MRRVALSLDLVWSGGGVWSHQKHRYRLLESHHRGIVPGGITFRTNHGTFLPGLEGFGNAEIDQDHPVVVVDHDVGGFQIPKDDRFRLVSM